MSDNLLSWTIRNWITVVLMWLVAYAVFAFGARMIAGRKEAKENDSPAGVFAMGG